VVVRADRLVSLVLLLQARGQVTARDLASELRVSVRTVYRDLAALSAAGVPVYAESGPGGGCRLVEDYRFPLRALHPDEAEALLILGVPDALRDLGLDGAVAAAHRQIRVTAGLDRTSARAEASAETSAEASAEAWAPLVHLDMPRWFRGHERVPQLRELATALRRRRRVRLRYSRPGGDPSRRVVDPLGLVNKAGTWYLVAATGSDRVRVFLVGNVTDVQVLDEAVGRPPAFDLAAFWEQWSQEFQASRPRLAVKVRASARALAAFPEVFGDAVREAVSAAAPPGEDGWQELTLSFEHELAAAHRLAGFGGQVEVLSPAAVRDQLLAAAREIVARYSTGPRDSRPIDGAGATPAPR
jgi:predicted DNA-binding transcriptional regulator YafY